MLEPHFKCKEIELQSCQKELRIEHVCKLNEMYYNESESNRNIMHKSNELLQHGYLLLSANGLMCSESDSKYKQLYKLHEGQRGVKFTTDDDDQTPDAQDDADNYMLSQLSYDRIVDNGLDFGDIQPLALESKAQQVITKAKRALKEISSAVPNKKFAASSSESSKPKASDLNTTQVLQKNDGEMDNAKTVDVTFSLANSKLATVMPKRIAARPLKDANIHNDKGESRIGFAFAGKMN